MNLETIVGHVGGRGDFASQGGARTEGSPHGASQAHLPLLWFRDVDWFNKAGHGRINLRRFLRRESLDPPEDPEGAGAVGHVEGRQPTPSAARHRS